MFWAIMRQIAVAAMRWGVRAKRTRRRSSPRMASLVQCPLCSQRQWLRTSAIMLRAVVLWRSMLLTT